MRPSPDRLGGAVCSHGDPAACDYESSSMLWLRS